MAGCCVQNSSLGLLVTGIHLALHLAALPPAHADAWVPASRKAVHAHVAACSAQLERATVHERPDMTLRCEPAVSRIPVLLHQTPLPLAAEAH